MNMAADDPGTQGNPNPQGSESGEMYRWQGATGAQVQENTRRLDAINGQIDKIERSQEMIRSDVRSLGEKLEGLVDVIGSPDKPGSLVARTVGIEKSQTATLQNVSSVDWKTIGTIVTLVVGPLVAAYLGAA